MALQPHQERVIVEKRDLDVKRNALAAFVVSPTFDGVDSPEQFRLRRQLVAMTEYSDVLGEP